MPAILQFCLETFRIGPISDHQYVQNIDFHEEYEVTKSFGFGITMMDCKYMKEFYSDTLFLWFILLANHFNQSEQPYMEWVELNSVPAVSTDKNYFCGLTVKDNEIMAHENSYFHELSKEKKEIYAMLARVLESQCILESEKLPYPHKNLLGPTFDEKETITKLIHFIIKNCKNYLLNK